MAVVELYRRRRGGGGIPVPGGGDDEDGVNIPVVGWVFIGIGALIVLVGLLSCFIRCFNHFKKPLDRSRYMHHTTGWSYRSGRSGSCCLWSEGKRKPEKEKPEPPRIVELDTECERDMAYAQRVYDAAMKRSTPDVAEKLKSSWKENFGIYQEKQNLSSAPKKGWREKYGIWQKKGHTDPEMVVKEVGREPRTY